MAKERECLAAIVVSFNTRELTLRCMRALLAEPDAVDEIWVVDNASSDGSPEALQNLHPKIHVLRMDQNVGFGAANNAAMRASKASVFALVNSDAFLEPSALGLLREHLRRNPGTGVVGPDLRNADGSPQVSRFRFPTPLSAWMENAGLDALWRLLRGSVLKTAPPSAWEWLSGACLLVRREVFEQTGGFDEAFFLYSEETDWQRRIREAGWRIDWVADARAVHLGGASGMDLKAASREHFFRGVDRYFWKHHGRLGWLQLRAAMVLGLSLRGLRAALGVSSPKLLPYWRWLLWRQLTAPPPARVEG
jgi:N-acetylglucosaminyl-diphospho-decaprenol L-rhamnosyltransferase